MPAIDVRHGVLAADRLPTLTEVVEPAPGFGGRLAAVAPAVTRMAPAALPDLLELSASVLAELQPRIELLFEARMREALALALAGAADGLLRDTREQLAGSLPTLVEEAVAGLLERQRQA